MNLRRLLKNKPRVQGSGQLKTLSEWFSGPQGARLLAEEEALLNRIVPDLFGLHCFVSGVHFPQEALKKCTVTHQFYSSASKIDVSNNSNTKDQQVITSLSALPFRSESVDAAILFHSLDFETRIYEAVKEVGRITIPGGSMVIIGFNPWSLWGAFRLCRPKSHQVAPWCSNFISMYRISDWLKLLDFEVEGYEGAFHFPSMHRSSWLDGLISLQNLSAQFVSQLGGVYVLVAKKRLISMMPVRPRWRVVKAPSFVSAPMAQIQGRLSLKPIPISSAKRTTAEPQRSKPLRGDPL